MTSRAPSASPGAPVPPPSGRPRSKSLRALAAAPLVVTWAPVLVLALQNLAIFFSHYFRDYGFPWDFIQGYYAMVAFWTSLVSQGVVPSWIPFDSMGLPARMMLQFGMDYPLFWIFPILRLEYTLDAAVVFQCLHVLLGAVGMLFFLRLVFGEQRKGALFALFGAFVFQFFGGFYSNAEHPDIVRAFALMPWCFYLFYLRADSAHRLSWRHLFIPLLILLVATGAYPGNLISAVLILGVFVVLQLVELNWQGSSLRALASFGASLALLTGLGFAMSMFHLGPPFVFSRYLHRSEQLNNLTLGFLGLEHLPALFLDNVVGPGDVSMTSTYLTLPTLVLLTFLPLRLLRKHWPMAGVLGLSLLMVSGPSSAVWFVLTRLFTPLKYSRFPSSDYRIFIAIALVYFSALALKALAEHRLPYRSVLFRGLLAALWFAEGVYVSYPTLRSLPVYLALAVFLTTCAVLAAHQFWLRKIRYPALTLAIPLFALAAVDAIRVLPTLDLPRPGASSISTWGLSTPHFSQLYQMAGWPYERDGHLLTYSILDNLPPSRPDRVEKAARSDFGWEGYITGRYVLFYSPMLESAFRVLDQPLYKRYMLLAWTPLYFPGEGFLNAGQDIDIPPEDLRPQVLAASHATSGPVRQTHYGINDIQYDVSLSHPMLMVENEIYFPGWTATLVTDGQSSEIEAVQVNQVFRGWMLPAGQYQMVARFALPYAGLFKAVSLGGFLAWAAVALSAWLRRRARATRLLSPA
jgi:hypothetical protein